ncbi:nuclear transport factor 2 family protein [Nocardioides sp. Bht2]|uniref:nuclear transport factor 2 family protein n=1 Tax=Nocardioides sp. Bht2 TaxID=3392297 RepID=UPI0039B45DEC
MASIEERKATVEQYLGLVSSGTADEIMALYAPDGTLEDPVGTDPKVGRDEIGAFYRSFEQLEIQTNLREVRASGESAIAFAFDVVTKLPDATMTVSAIEVMTFDDAGLITSMKAYWSPEADMVMA